MSNHIQYSQEPTSVGFPCVIYMQELPSPSWPKQFSCMIYQNEPYVLPQSKGFRCLICSHDQQSSVAPVCYACEIATQSTTFHSGLTGFCHVIYDQKQIPSIWYQYVILQQDNHDQQQYQNIANAGNDIDDSSRDIKDLDEVIPFI